MIESFPPLIDSCGREASLVVVVLTVSNMHSWWLMVCCVNICLSMLQLFQGWKVAHYAKWSYSAWTWADVLKFVHSKSMFTITDVHKPTYILEDCDMAWMLCHVPHKHTEAVMLTYTPGYSQWGSKYGGVNMTPWNGSMNGAKIPDYQQYPGFNHFQVLKCNNTDYWCPCLHDKYQDHNFWLKHLII